MLLLYPAARLALKFVEEVVTTDAVENIPFPELMTEQLLVVLLCVDTFGLEKGAVDNRDVGGFVDDVVANGDSIRLIVGFLFTVLGDGSADLDDEAVDEVDEEDEVGADLNEGDA